VLFVSLILGFVAAHALFETPNVIGGGAAKMIVGLFFMVLFKATIEFCLRKWQDKRDAKRNDTKA